MGPEGVAEPLVPVRDEGDGPAEGVELGVEGSAGVERRAAGDENLTEAVANRPSHTESEVRCGQAQMTVCQCLATRLKCLVTSDLGSSVR